MEVGEAEFLEIRDLGANAFEVSGVAVDVADAAEHVALLEPCRMRGPMGVEPLQVGGPSAPRVGDEREQLSELRVAVVSAAVDVEEMVVQHRIGRREARLETAKISG